MYYLSLDKSLPYIESYVGPGMGFFRAALHAFRFHKNLVLNPDSFLHALIVQASSLIISNPELYRADLVNHSDQLTLTVIGEIDMWKKFAAAIDIKNEAFKTLMNLKFSTSTEKSMVARYCTIAATFSPYYNYCVTECGLRGIYIEGNTRDWLQLRDSLDGFGFLSKIHQSDATPNPVLEWITDSKSIVDYCIETLGNSMLDPVDIWKGFVTEKGISGGPFIGGHMAKMMLIDHKGNLIDRNCKNLATYQIPNEQLSVTVNFDHGPRKYLVGNNFYMSNDDTDCITYPDIREAK